MTFLSSKIDILSEILKAYNFSNFFSILKTHFRLKKFKHIFLFRDFQRLKDLKKNIQEAAQQFLIFFKSFEDFRTFVLSYF